MKTKITFKAVSEREVTYKTLEIEHPRFEEIPEQMFNGVKLPRTSIESQVIDYLDSIDKKDLMIENDFDIIIDYWPRKKRSKNGKDKEIKEFITFCKPYLTMFPELIRPFRAVISNSKGILFGHHKSNETKFKEVLNLIDTAYKATQGVLNMVTNTINKRNNKSNLLENHEV